MASVHCHDQSTDGNTAVIQKLLIANRGEIACRIMRTAKRLDIRTVAVYSDADAGAMHVAQADEAVHIGASPAAQSYLVGERVIDAALRAGADAIHPGYGFLAENANFAASCIAAGLRFVGPAPEAIRSMGSKAGAKALMAAAGVPIVPGYHEPEADDATLLTAANDVGFPLLVKASAGGGGKGMRVVHEAAALPEALASARREARAAFGDDSMLLERYIPNARHIEVQIFFDNHGHGVHLFERDCSAQRRYQKVLEEAPAPGLDDDMRGSMYAAALAAGHAVGYSGAGTVEMIAGHDAFFFMEMNTRLQVEHPVTEQITGLDLVEWQLRVAANEPLPMAQADIVQRGHAIEVRVYAEDPTRGFLPATGTLQHLRFPTHDADVRIDTGVRLGDAISIHYDPMIAKVITTGADRDAALVALRRALAGTQVAGLTTNVAFLGALARHRALAEGRVHTAMLDTEGAALAQVELSPRSILTAACAWFAIRDANARREASPWACTDGWRLNQGYLEPLTLRSPDGEDHLVDFIVEQGKQKLALAGTTTAVAFTRIDDERVRITLDGTARSVSVAIQHSTLTLFETDATTRFEVIDPLAINTTGSADSGSLNAPMPGKILATHVSAGQTVQRGDALVLMEAMKMEHTISAPGDGVVAELCYGAGDTVDEGAVLVVLSQPQATD
jgi:3-methylcrotonyl-CoA carboxylase alpha subunit